jgi:hypothetical protein
MRAVDTEAFVARVYLEITLLESVENGYILHGPEKRMADVEMMEDLSVMHDVMCIGRRARACKRLSEAAKTLTTRSRERYRCIIPQQKGVIK